MELFRALGVLCEPPTPRTATLAAALEIEERAPTEADHTELFLFQLYPYASVYLGPEGQLGGPARDRVAGFWHALGLVPPAEPDHLTVLLGLYASLAEEESEPDEARRLLRRRARAALLWEHLLSWLPPYLGRVAELGGRFYGGWARLLGSALQEEAGRLGPPDRPPAHLRDVPDLPDPCEVGGDAFLAGLLAPLRSGLILARADLARCASELGVGLRVAERSYVLKALLAQDPAGTLTWLAGEARRQLAMHRHPPAIVGTSSAFWADRAEAAAALLEQLQPAAKEVGHVSDVTQVADEVTPSGRSRR